MIKKSGNKQVKMMCYTIEELMPTEHFLRDLDKHINFNFIYEKVEHLYSETGRPSIDPVVIVKMLLIGYLYGIDSERQLEKEITVNIAYRWFLGIDLDETVPDHSTLSQLRRRKFKGTEIFRKIFEEIVYRCIEAGLVNGELLLTDSTHIKANVSDAKRELISVKVEPSAYVKRLNEFALRDGLITETEKVSTAGKKEMKEVTRSTSDPDSGILNRTGKPVGFHYLSHNTVDGNSGIITDVHVTPGNERDSTPHSERIQYQINKFGFKTKEVGGDAGYDVGEIHSDMLRIGVKTYIAPIIYNKSKIDKDVFKPCDFSFDSETNCYICPNGCILKYLSYNKTSGMKEYISSKKDCKNCPSRDKCFSSKSKFRIIVRHFHQTEMETQRKNNLTSRYNEIMKKRQIWCEGNFSHQKARHCLTRAKMRGISKVSEQCLLSACALNLIRLVKTLKYTALICVFCCFSRFSLSYVKI